MLPLTVPKQALCCLVFACTLLCSVTVFGDRGQSGLSGKPLLLSFNPPSSNGPDCGHETASPPASGHPGPHGQHGQHGPVMESEHRPVPMRQYHLTEIRRLAQVQAYVRRPDGMVVEPQLHLGVNPGIAFPTPMGGGPNHGAHNVYVVEKAVENKTLIVRTAQWITMHHNCGWGHDGKFDTRLTTPQPIGTIPFEIVMNELWDPNFHASVTSGNELVVTVLSYGKPLAGAEVIISTENGWSKSVVTDNEGKAELQLIRDYYPVSWKDFHRDHRGKFLVTARYEAPQSGNYRNTSYERVSYISTLPWKYSPSTNDYMSYSYGLLVGTLSLTVSGVGVYAYRERRKKPYKRITFDE